jgi:hypothetical protein
VTAATFAKGLEELPRFEWRGVPYPGSTDRHQAESLRRALDGFVEADRG